MYHRGGSRTRLAIFVKGVQSNLVSGFTRDLITAQIKRGKGKNQESVVVCLTYFPSDSAEMPPATEFKELAEYNSEKKLELPIASDANTHHTVWICSGVDPRRESLCGISWHWIH